MKAKVIKTGEVVEVHKTTAGWASDDLNHTRFFKESDLDFDYCEWEDFRREAAKDVLCAIVANNNLGYYGDSNTRIAASAIAIADELIKQLKEE